MTAARYTDQLAAAATLARSFPAAGIDGLADRLYEYWYAPAATGPAPSTPPAQLLSHLRAADALGDRFEPGWTALDGATASRLIGPPASPWQSAATRDGDTRWFDPIDYVAPAAIGVRPAAGTPLQVARRRDSTAVLPGWWTTFSPGWARSSPPIIRLYWSVQPSALCALVHALTSRLDPNTPYSLKCPLDTRRALRPDGVVLYLPAREWTATIDAIHAVHAALATQLRSTTPMLTLPLAPGLSLAEDPEDGSFGMHRCRLLAGALAANHDPRAALDALRGAGLTLDAPYRNPESTMEYPW